MSGFTAVDHQAAAEVFARGGTASDAARAAGAKGTDRALAVVGHRLKHRPEVIELTQRIRQELKDGNLITARNWLDRASELYDRTQSDMVKQRVLDSVARFHSLFQDRTKLEVTQAPSLTIKGPTGRRLFELGQSKSKK